VHALPVTATHASQAGRRSDPVKRPIRGCGIGCEGKESVVKAIRLHRRGGPDQLVLDDAPVPETASGDVLVRVAATGITPTELGWDETYQHADGSPRIPSIPGHEVSGVVERVAPDVDDFQPGDAVYGLADFPRDGAAAEFVAVRAANLARKPQSIGHTEAASLPLSALTACHALFENGQLVAGQSVLIHAGAGGVGSLAVQLAHWRGVRVVATASARDVAFVRSLGADVVVDYHAERFEDTASDVDVVFDTVGGETQERSLRVLRKGGVLVSVVAPVPPGVAERFGVRGVYFIVEGNRAQLAEIAALVDAGKLKPIIAEVFPLERAREAFEFGAASHSPGKIILSVAATSS
jgi:NADPH:quinone reductase-like Zn-dependent oxidoreductase